MEKRNDVGAIWRKTGKSGVEYWTVLVRTEGGQKRYVAFRNQYKDKESQPDYRLYESDESYSKAPAVLPGPAAGPEPAGKPGSADNEQFKRELEEEAELARIQQELSFNDDMEVTVEDIPF